MADWSLKNYSRVARRFRIEVSFLLIVGFNGIEYDLTKDFIVITIKN
jgi:hypothetical protein